MLRRLTVKGGINKAFSLGEFANGRSTLVALEELRAGIGPPDPRGAWALGQIGGSITWAHGVNGDAAGPNNPWPRSDDILGCPALHAAVGSQTLRSEGMPCAHYIDANQQASSRSLHPGGVNVSFADGSVKFIKDTIDSWAINPATSDPAIRSRTTSQNSSNPEAARFVIVINGVHGVAMSCLKANGPWNVDAAL
jgi:prepilin-type processing-associated H-X9-DG protein